jgi:hypothetical protein
MDSRNMVCVVISNLSGCERGCTPHVFGNGYHGDNKGQTGELYEPFLVGVEEPKALGIFYCVLQAIRGYYVLIVFLTDTDM